MSEEQIKSSQSDYNKTKQLPSLNDIYQLCSSYFKVQKNTLFKVRSKENTQEATGVKLIFEHLTP